MKALKILIFLPVFLCAGYLVKAQSDSAAAIRRAMLFADSLDKSFRYGEWNAYINLSYPGIVKYYGGEEGYRQFAERSRSLDPHISKENPAKLEVIQVMNDISEWQCVIRKTRQTIIDGSRAYVVSYMIGQSKDEGQHWKYVDVAYNSVENVIYIMPDIFDRLSIPQRQIFFEKDQLAKKS